MRADGQARQPASARRELAGDRICGARTVAAQRYREDMGEPPLIRIGHPPRGRRAVPFGWPERLTAIALGFLLLMLIWGLS